MIISSPPTRSIAEFLKNIQPPQFDYKPLSNETYFASENFATVDNLFAEELKLGDFSRYQTKAAPVEIKLYPVPEYNPEIEELTEDEIELLENFDLIVDGSLRPYAAETANRDKILIYERKSKG